MDKNLEISLLFDFYKDMLTDTQQQAVSLYYNDDLSLKETADILGMSRQGVRDALTRAKTSLFEYEEKLSLCARFDKTSVELDSILQCTQQIEELSQDEKLLTLVKSINESVHRLYETEV
ncbi:MAG: UPF0175 family protein [Ruminococcus sp.]|nr:UPF0175 family protein [Ruminococcus sp.]